MRKYYVIMIMSLLFMFVFSTNVFAASIRNIEVSDIDYPYIGEKVDKDVRIRRGSCTIKEVVWYKDGIKFLGDTFSEKGNYYCRIYLIPNDGYEIESVVQVTSNAKISTIGQDFNGYFCELQYVVDLKKIEYPNSISFIEMNKPELNKALDYSVVSEQPEFYECTKIEWYSNNQLLHNRVRVQEGEYVCRVYMEFLNGFEINSKVIAMLEGKKADKIIRDHTGIYFEIVYNVSEKEESKEVLIMNFTLKETPSYGQAIEKVNVLKTGRSNYYEVGDVIWYRNGYRMLDDYFYDGTYLCRIYINFINGGYPVNTTVAYIGGDSRDYNCKWMDNRWYVEREFIIKEYTVSTLKFNELNVPEYGSVQDTRIESLEPGVYSPSMVYWYNEQGKYMSNIETFEEGKYTCKFTINLNVNCKVKENLKAIINDSNASAYMENNKITIKKTYEVKKQTTKWSKASDWAIPELKNAIDYALIPTSIENQDFTQNITRAEFAAVAVRLYEALTLKSARPIEKNPFTDTTDSEALKAYNLGITNGTSATTFDPNSLITRQEMATMMVRTLEKAGVSTSINLNNVKKFSDHEKIEDWALNGVYFMSSIGIIKGKGNNVFDVLGSATREEALAISIRSVNYYK